MEAAKKIIGAADRLINLIVALLLILALLYGCYALFDNYTLYQKADLDRNIQALAPSTETITNSNPNIKELQAINPDVAAWLTITDTSISYPVLLGTSNNTYLNKDLYGEFSLAGSIFMESQAKADFSDFCTIIYGHNMDGNRMFANLLNYANDDYFQNHLSGWLFLPEQTYQLEIFAYFSTDAYNYRIYSPSVSTTKEKEKWLSYIQTSAMHYQDGVYQANDHFILLSTCSSGTTNGRSVVVAKLIPWEDENPLEYEKSEVSA